ncbi:MAG: FAD/NAD(P)-binding protein [Actinobacteria bacterium]|nr:FAD/NAD(P)-binding protein [Actinomycetota bacterium]
MTQLFVDHKAPPRTGARLPAANRRVAIVGGGAAGTLSAIHLLRAASEPLDLAIVDAGGRFGPGVAYGTPDPLHLLNVPAGRMGGIAGRPDHFLRWLRARGHDVEEADFLPRRRYGEYLEAQLAAAIATADPASRITLHHAEAHRLAEKHGGGLILELSAGDSLEADHAVLAVGPLPGGDPVEVPAEVRASGRCVADPWRPRALDRAREASDVLIVGTGLTMVDVALSLATARPRMNLHAISRHGFVPRSHRRELTAIEPFPIPTDEGTIDQVAAAFFDRIAVVSQEGGDWRDVVDSARPLIPAVWQSLEPAEKRRFLARFQRLWEIHRFRVAPDGAERLAALRRAGRLRVSARRLARLEAIRGGVRAWLDGGDAGPEPLEVGAVISCCGAATDIRHAAPPLVAGLIDDGLARPDALGLGLDIGPGGALLDRAGRASLPVHVVGALRRGVEWEAISVTEIRDQADLVAREIVARRGAKALA